MAPKLLFVDDEIIQFKTVIKFLEHYEYIVKTALNGLEAFEIMEDFLPDIILLDITMPLMSGYDFCEKIKANPKLKDIPIIFLTATTNKEDIIKGFELGAIDYITKPIIELELFHRLNNHLKLINANNKLLEWNSQLVRTNEGYSHEVQSTQRDFISFINNLPNAAIRIRPYGRITIANYEYFKINGMDNLDFHKFLNKKATYTFVLPKNIENEIALHQGEYSFNKVIKSMNYERVYKIKIKEAKNPNTLKTEYYDLSFNDITMQSLDYQVNSLIIDAINQIKMSVMITNKNGEIIYVNNHFIFETGYTFSEVQNHTPRILKGNKTPGEYYIDLWQTIQSGKIWKGKFINRKKDGSSYLSNPIIIPIKNNNKEIQYFVCLNNNDPEIQQLRKESENYKTKLDEEHNFYNFILKRIAQEMAPPITALMNYSCVLAASLKNDKEKRIADAEQVSANRLMKLLSVMNKFTELNNYNYDENFAEFDIINLVNKIITNLESSLTNKNIKIKNNSQLSSFIINSDEALISELFNQIIGNSIRFSEEGVILCDVIFENNYDSIAIVISDNGLGFESEMLQKIISAITPNSSQPRTFEGLGLGLSLVYKIVSLLNGQINIESSQNGGTIILIMLPLK